LASDWLAPTNRGYVQLAHVLCGGSLPELEMMGRNPAGLSV
jgi:hypothetical protein